MAKFIKSSGAGKSERVSNTPNKQQTGIGSFFIAIKKTYVKYMTFLGAHVFHGGKHAVNKAKKLLHIIASAISKELIKTFKKLVVILKKFKEKIISPFKRTVVYFKELKIAMHENKEKIGYVSAVKLCITSVMRSLWGFRGIFVTAFNYVAPIVSIAFLVNLITYASNIQYGVSVECNGTKIGFISEEQVYDEAQKVMQERITYVEGDEIISVVPKFSVQKLNPEEVINDEFELADKMLRNSDEAITNAYGFYMNGQFYGAMLEKDTVENALEQLLNTYKTRALNETVQFVDTFEFKEGLYLESGLVDIDAVVNTLISEKQVEAYYTIVQGDSPTLIADKNSIPYAELKILNPQIETSCLVGSQVLLNREEPYLSIKATRTQEYDIVVDYKTIEIEDASKYKDAETVIVKGKEGSAHVTANVTYINNYEETRTITNKVVIVEPVDKKVSVGTKPFTGASQSSISSAKGNYLWPVAGGYISSYMGDGRGHKGIDIAAPYGTAIYAAEDGTVTMSKKNGAYGECIIIDHGNGYQTLYAHQSKRIAAVGQTVKKGDLIGLVGTTGQSTGNHLHFEVRYFGTFLNPTNFVSK